MAREGTQIILLNDRREVLLYLRDDKPQIAYPNQWCLLGGMIEPGETPLECIVREIEEEIGIVLDPSEVEHVRTRNLHFGIEHTLCATRRLVVSPRSGEEIGRRFLGLMTYPAPKG